MLDIIARPVRICRSAALTGLLAFAVVAAGPARAEGTYAQRMACTGDAFRLCSDYIPDATAVRACMIAKKPQLSEGCRATFARTTASR